MISRDANWPPGQGYRTPKPEVEIIPIFGKCGTRHLDPIPWCGMDNKRKTNA